MKMREKNSFFPFMVHLSWCLFLFFIGYICLVAPSGGFQAALIALLCMIVSLNLVTNIVGFFVVGRHYDRSFLTSILDGGACDHSYTEFARGLFTFKSWRNMKQYRFYRSVIYLRCLAWPKLSKDKAPYNYLFDGYDFRANATPMGLGLGYVAKALFYLLVIHAICVACYLVTHLSNIKFTGSTAAFFSSILLHL